MGGTRGSENSGTVGYFLKLKSLIKTGLEDRSYQLCSLLISGHNKFEEAVILLSKRQSVLLRQRFAP